MKTNNTVKVRVYRLGWSGMKKETITVSAYPKEVLKVDDWFSPQIGELCFNDFCLTESDLKDILIENGLST